MPRAFLREYDSVVAKVSRNGTTREAWLPQTKQDRDEVLLELHRISVSPHFCNSKRYPALLQYIVESTLAGRAELLKERTLGVEVFDRPPQYDTNSDTVVRYTAGEVRKRLSLYYHELDQQPAIQILLPTGSYVPEFLRTDDEIEEQPSTQPVRTTAHKVMKVKVIDGKTGAPAMLAARAW